MTTKAIDHAIVYIFCFLLSGIQCRAQDVEIKIGFKDSVRSAILNENRNLIISLPESYDTSKVAYPVLYLLDGSVSNLFQAKAMLLKLGYEHFVPEMILVAIANTNRDRDMMPLDAKSYPVISPGAEKFLAFIGDELIPHMEENYRTSDQRILRGGSLAAVFTIYAFLKDPQLFSDYIAISGGWFADMDPYFNALIDSSFQSPNNYLNKKLFIANSLQDPFDPNGEVHKSILRLSAKIKSELGNRVDFIYKTYTEYGHVPYPAFYDGMKYIFR